MAAGINPEDLTVVGSDLRSAAVTAFAWPGAQLLRTSGTDAVDYLLLEELVPSPSCGEACSAWCLDRATASLAGRLAQLRSMGVRVEASHGRFGLVAAVPSR